MAHAAEIDGSGTVLRVIVIPDDVVDEQDFCANVLGHGGTWKRTAKDGSVRKNYAGPGYSFDEGRDAFVPPKPFASWVIDESTARWTAPKGRPADGKNHTWDEAGQRWTEIPDEEILDAR